MKSRRNGILLHVTSLPSEFGIGDLGRGAYTFADFLADSSQTLWQVLPFNPSSPVCGNSPYCSFSAFAGNPLLVAPDLLVEDGYISSNDLSLASSFDSTKVDYEKAAAFKSRIMGKAYENFREMPDEGCRYEDFVNANADWLDDYALFMSLKDHFSGALWNEWPPEIRDRTQPALDEWTEKLADSVKREKFNQFLFFRQWSALKSYCNQKRIQVIGDIPIYVSYDSADVWANCEYFKLDSDKRPAFVAGVPPDYFSDTGQLWGNPVYSWDKLKETFYEWWIRRIEHNLKCFDMVRLDHFRGFVAYGEVPAAEKTAVNGKWVKTPAEEFFRMLLRRFPSIPLIAEDLGVITPEVREIMSEHELPGMKVLLFAFGGSTSTNPYIPHNHVENCVVYTGTHDNNTVKGWFEHDATEIEKENLNAYFGGEFDENTVAGQLVRTAMMSVASTAIIPIQDFLELGAEARMNTPSVAFGNWEWRVAAAQLTPDLSAKISNLTKVYGRV
ncbi:MAG: 4-alpha-glucanotransferase [Syntrophobacteraceae bacterium]